MVTTPSFLVLDLSLNITFRVCVYVFMCVCFLSVGEHGGQVSYSVALCLFKLLNLFFVCFVLF